MNKQLKEISKLKDNWNEHDAPAFDKKYIQKVDKFVSKLKVKPFIAPLPIGAVQLEYVAKDSYMEIILYRDGKMCIYDDDVEGSGVWEKTFDKWDIKKINEMLKKYKDEREVK